MPTTPSATETPTQETVVETATASPSQTPSETAAEPTETATSLATDTPTVSIPTATPTEALAPFCDLPGSVQTTADGIVVVPGGAPEAPDLRWLHLPVGFCAHYFGNVGNTRQLRFAPGGELFVASPTTTTTGGGQRGQSAIVVLPDDDHDGTADSQITFLTNLPSTQGLLFTGGYFYYQDRTQIMRMPYAPGDRTPSASGEMVANITHYSSALHWPKTLDIADDGTIYVTNGGDQLERCDPGHPFRGGVLALDGPVGGSFVSKGYRNAISIRCARGHNRCFAVELSRDFSADIGGREKIVEVNWGDDVGFPCCATKDLLFPDIAPPPDCTGIAAESTAFFIGDTPFDIDFETGRWPFPWNNSAYVPLHGSYGDWIGARLVAVAMDPNTGQLLPSSDLDGGSMGAMSDFAVGWDDHTFSHGRPAAVAFAPDGRLFLGNDNNGVILWIAPLDLRP